MCSARLVGVLVSNRSSSSATDRALAWNAACVTLILVAIATGFVDAIPIEVTLGLCALGVVAGLVGVPLYVAHVLAGWRSPRRSRATADSAATNAGKAGSDVATTSGAAAAVADDHTEQAGTEQEAAPETGLDREPEEGDSGRARADSTAETSPASTQDLLPRCPCHGLPISQ